MCVDREKCEEVFERIRVLRVFCKQIGGEIRMQEKVGGQITGLIWKLCPDCRGVFLGKAKIKREEKYNGKMA